MLFGTDLSKWNGKVDFTKYDLDFAILKVTQKNNSVETAFETNFKNANKRGLLLGVYKYVYAKTVNEAKEEANAIIKVLNSRPLQMGIWLDMEDSSIKNIGKGNLTKIINTMNDILVNAGYKVGIYCNLDWYNNVLNGKELSKKYEFWIARYGANSGKLEDRYKPNVNNMVAWQYTSKGFCPGVNGPVDLNVWYSHAKVSDEKVETKEYYPKYIGNDKYIDPIFKVIGAPYGSVTNRRIVAEKNGITKYRGTLLQNLKLIKLAKEGKLKK